MANTTRQDAKRVADGKRLTELESEIDTITTNLTNRVNELITIRDRMTTNAGNVYNSDDITDVGAVVDAVKTDVGTINTTIQGR